MTIPASVGRIIVKPALRKALGTLQEKANAKSAERLASALNDELNVLSALMTRQTGKPDNELDQIIAHAMAVGYYRAALDGR